MIRDVDKELIDEAVRAKVAPKTGSTARKPKPRKPHTYKTIETAVMQSYVRDMNQDPMDRILDAVQWFTVNYPHWHLSGTLLYWMVFGGSKLPPCDSIDVRKLMQRVGRLKEKMLDKYKRTLEVCQGKVRAYVDGEDAAIHAMPKVAKTLARHARYASKVQESIGDPKSLKGTAETKPLLDHYRRHTLPAIQAITSQLPALQLPMPK